MNAPTPTRVHYHKQARELGLGYASGDTYRLPVELLRVYSPSAEVRGHGGDTAVLQVGKRKSACKILPRPVTTRSNCTLMTVTTAACLAGTTCLTLPHIKMPIGRTISNAWKRQGPPASLRAFNSSSCDAVPQVKRRQAGVGKATMLPTTYCDDLTVDNYRLELGS